MFMTIIVPIQLQNCRFVKVDGQKRPYEKAWQTVSNYSSTDIGDQKSYGVLCGINGLVVLDCDTVEAESYLKSHPIIGATFQVKTAGKWLTHFYLYTDTESPATRRYNVVKDGSVVRAIDMQGAKTQVVGPNSILDNGKKYEVALNAPILHMPYDDIVKYLGSKFTEQNKPTHSKYVQQDFIEIDPVVSFVKKNIIIRDVLDTVKHDPVTNPGICPLGHDSVSKKNFSFTDEVYHCFHCESRGNIFQLYMALHKCGFQTALNALAEIAGVPDTLRKQSLAFYAQKNKEEATEYLATKFLEKNHIYTIRSFKKPEIWIYRHGIYIPEGETYIQEFVRAALGSFYNVQRVNNIIAKIAADTYCDPEAFFINEHVTKLPVQNGILDLETRKLEQFNPKYKFFNKLPVVYDAAADCPTFKRFQREIVAHDCDMLVNQEFYGFCLYREYKFEKAVMKIGNGRNGKGKDIEMLKTLLGPKNVEAIPLQQLETDKFIVSALHNKMANLGGDIESDALTKTAKFKTLTGRDTITCDRKFLTPIQFKSFAKMVFAANNLPDVPRDDSLGFANRWIMIEYPYVFLSQSEIDAIPADDIRKVNGLVRLGDPDLINKMNIELSGVLNWALDGLQRLLRQNAFTPTSIGTRVMEVWKRKASSATAFIDDELTLDYEMFVSVSELKQKYHQYCATHKVRPEMWRVVHEKIDAFGGIKERKLLAAVGQNVYGWRGIAWKNNPIVAAEKFTGVLK
jgi:P4 family phage/plasmid primase-like protien